MDGYEPRKSGAYLGVPTRLRLSDWIEWKEGQIGLPRATDWTLAEHIQYLKDNDIVLTESVAGCDAVSD